VVGNDCRTVNNRFESVYLNVSSRKNLICVAEFR